MIRKRSSQETIIWPRFSKAWLGLWLAGEMGIYILSVSIDKDILTSGLSPFS